MFESTVSVQIEASVNQVYRRLKDFTRHSEFSGGLARIEQLSGGPIGVGTRFRAQETVPGRYVSYAEITALQEPHVIAWKAWVAGVMRTEWEFRLTPTANGTRLVQVSCWEPAGLLGHPDAEPAPQAECTARKPADPRSDQVSPGGRGRS
jgi:hypothetical protein